MKRFARSLLLFLLLSNSALAAICREPQTGKASPLYMAQIKSLSPQKTHPQAEYLKDSIGESPSDVRLSVDLLRMAQGMPMVNRKFMYVSVTDSRLAWESEYSIRASRDEMICLLRSGDSVLLAFPRNDHVATVWSIDQAKGTVAFFEEIPYASPLLAERNGGRFHGRNTQDRQTGSILVEVPITDIKEGLIAASLKLYKGKGLRGLLGDGLTSKETKERKAVLYANAALQCALECIDESIQPSTATITDSPFLYAADSFAGAAFWLSNNIWTGGNVIIPSIPEETMALWPENHAILLARLALLDGDGDLAESILKVLAKRQNLQHRPVITMLQAYVETVMGKPEAASRSVLSLQLAEKAVYGRCARLLADIDAERSFSPPLPDELLEMDECWLGIAVLRDARMLNLIHAIQSPASKNALELDSLQGMVRGIEPMFGLIIAYSNRGQYAKAMSLFESYREKMTPSQIDRARIMKGSTLVNMDRLFLKVEDRATGMQFGSIYIDRATLEPLLFDRILWQCSGSKAKFLEWLVSRDFGNSFTKEQCLAKLPQLGK